MTTLTRKKPMQTPKIWTPNDATHENHASGSSLKSKKARSIGRQKSQNVLKWSK